MIGTIFKVLFPSIQASGKVENIIECWEISIWHIDDQFFISKVENEIWRNRQFVTADRSFILKFTEWI